MNLLGLLPGILKTVGKVLGIGKLTEAAEALSTASISPEKQAELQQALLVHEKEMKQLAVDELKVVMSESLAMIQSEDKYTARARPTMLYVATGITALLCVAVGIAVLRHGSVSMDTVAAITSLMAPLWGVSGWYVHSRTKEKISNGTS